MKAKPLKYPYSWEERKPLISDEVFFIPDYFLEHENYSINLDEIFKNPNPVNIEYCSGNGEWITNQALKYPDINWIAVEQKLDRVQKIWARMKRLQIKNLFLVNGEAHTFTKYYLKENYFDKICINFPDPWPKFKHAKHRLLNQHFVQQLIRVLKKEGKLIFVTDDQEYSQSTINLLLTQKDHLISELPYPYFINEMEGYGSSYFEDLWRQKGKVINYSIFKKNKHV